MLRSPNSLNNRRQSPLSIDDSKTLSALVMKPSSARSSSRESLTRQQDDSDDENQTLRKLIARQPTSLSRSRSSNNVLLKSMVIDGRWTYQAKNDDQLRLKTMGIENLVSICHDIMNKTLESTNRREKHRRKSPLIHETWPIVQLDKFKKLTNTDRASLKSARIFNLMTIVNEAATTSASISQLVCIWREAAEHILNPPRRKPTYERPLISYEHAFQHLIRRPDDQLLGIALHASLVNTHSRSELRRLGEKLGVKKDQFDINSIRDSSEAFEKLIQFLRAHRLRKKRYIDTNKLPYDKKPKRGLYANVAGAKYPLICQAVDISGFTISSDCDFTSNLLWNDTLISTDIVLALKPYQKINHFLSMNQITQKDSLAKNHERLSCLLPKDYNFIPKTWTLPNDYNAWYSYASHRPKQKSMAYIVRPTDASTGQNVSIHCDYKKIQCMNNCIIQEYISEPALIDGFKFDVGVYALITSCDPLRVFIFNNGLVRICSKKYNLSNSKNIFNRSMHLTNYKTDDDDFNDDSNAEIRKRRTLKYTFEYLREQGLNIDKLWKEIQDIVLKTIFLVHPYLLTSYRSSRPGALPTSESVCFELLSFNILIDNNSKPWLMKVDRCPNFDTQEQVEFDVKIKLLYDTLDLLRFRVSDKQKSRAIEKLEAQRRLYSSIGKTIDNHSDPLNELRETLYLLQRENAREVFENHHQGGYIRLFPINNNYQMNQLMNILAKSFQIVYPNKTDLLLTMKYYHQYNEQDLLNQIKQFENVNQKNRQETLRLTSDSNDSRAFNRSMSLTSFTFESSDDENKSSPRSSRKKRPPSKTDPFTKAIATQTPSDILRSTLSTPSETTKQNSLALPSTGEISRSDKKLRNSPPGVRASRITEKKAFYKTSPPSSPSPIISTDQRSHSPKSLPPNDKIQMVTRSSILQANRKREIEHQLTITDMKKELQLTDNDVDRLEQLILEELNKLSIRYPNKSDRETYDIHEQIIENWDQYKADIGRFWLVQLDTEKRETVVKIVWNNLQQIMKKICIFDELIPQLPLNRHLMKLEQRLLANHGQCLWDSCQNKHNSWESLFLKSTNYLTDIELDCCYRFVDLCKEALFIVYQYSIDEKSHKQTQQTDRRLTLMIQS